MLVSAASRLLYEYLCRTYPAVTLGDIAEVSSGGTPPKALPHYWGGAILWAAPRDLKAYTLQETAFHLSEEAIRSKAARLVSSEATLVVTRGMILARYVPIVHADQPFACNQDIRCLVARGKVHPRYLSAVLLGAERHLFARVTDSTAGQRRIENEALLSLPIPVPDNHTQHASAQFIQAASSGLEGFRAAARACSPALAHIAGTALRLLEIAEKTDAARRIRQDTLRSPDVLLAGEECRIWPASSVGRAPTLEQLSIFLARGRQSEQGTSEHLLIKTQHVQQGRYVPSLLRLAPHAARRVDPEALARDGDILVACSAAGCLGRVARYKGDGRPASTDTHVAIVRANPSMIEPDYLYAYLSGAQGQHQLRSRERGDWRREKVGFRLTELNVRDLKKVPVPLPDRTVQRRIVRAVEDLRARVRALKLLQQDSAAAIDALMPSALDRALRGEL